MRKFRSLFFSLVTVQAMILGGSFASANPIIPAQAAQDNDPAKQQRVEYDALVAIQKEKVNQKKLEMAQEFLTKYPSSSYAQYAKSQLYTARAGLYGELNSAGKTDDAFKIGGEIVKDDPKQLPFMLALVDLSTRQQLSGNTKFIEEGSKYAQQALALIAAGEKLNIPDWGTKKSEYEATAHRALAFNNFNAKKTDEAIAEFTKATEIDCADPIGYYYIGIIHGDRYRQSAKKYNDLPNTDKAGEPGKALLDEAKVHAGKSAEFYAKAIAASMIHAMNAQYEGFRTQIKKELNTMYEVSHEDKLDGLEPMIEGFKTSMCKK